MHKHGVNSNLFRNRQEKLVKTSQHYRRILGEVYYLFHGFGGKISYKAGVLFKIGHLFADRSLTFRLAGHHIGRPQDANKLISRANRMRAR